MKENYPMVVEHERKYHQMCGYCKYSPCRCDGMGGRKALNDWGICKYCGTDLLRGTSCDCEGEMQVFEPLVIVALPPDIQRVVNEEEAEQARALARYQEERRQLRASGAIPGRVMGPRPVRPPRG